MSIPLSPPPHITLKIYKIIYSQFAIDNININIFKFKYIWLIIILVLIKKDMMKIIILLLKEGKKAQKIKNFDFFK